MPTLSQALAFTNFIANRQLSPKQAETATAVEFCWYRGQHANKYLKSIY